MSRIQFIHTYDTIISFESLLDAWMEFSSGKTKRKDVQMFQLRLMDNILDLHSDLKNRTYTHRGYEAFTISDPKARDIHKASVRDRIVHRVIYEKMYPFFNHTFISDSFSCRRDKGTHRALKRYVDFSRKITQNNTKRAWVLKCDIRKFFASIDQGILISILEQYIPDNDILKLLNEIITSFQSTQIGNEIILG